MMKDYFDNARDLAHEMTYLIAMIEYAQEGGNLPVESTVKLHLDGARAARRAYYEAIKDASV